MISWAIKIFRRSPKIEKRDDDDDANQLQRLQAIFNFISLIYRRYYSNV